MTKRKDKDSTRITITMPQTTKYAIKSLAERMDVSESFAAQHLIKIGLMVEAIAYDGGEIVARIPGGTERVLADRLGVFIQRLPRLPKLKNADLGTPTQDLDNALAAQDKEVLMV